MDEQVKISKLSVELKQTAKGFWYTGSLKVNADDVDELNKLLLDALAEVDERIKKLNSREIAMNNNVQDIKQRGEGDDAGARRADRKEPEEFHFNEYEQKLLDKLKELRTLLAKKNNYPPYAVFHDSTLKKIVKEKPQTKEELAKVIGDKKFARYGEYVFELMEMFGGVR